MRSNRRILVAERQNDEEARQHKAEGGTQHKNFTKSLNDNNDQIFITCISLPPGQWFDYKKNDYGLDSGNGKENSHVERRFFARPSIFVHQQR